MATGSSVPSCTIMGSDQTLNFPSIALTLYSGRVKLQRNVTLFVPQAGELVNKLTMFFVVKTHFPIKGVD